MPAKQFLSVVIPVHNAACYLATAVESILAQTYPNFELILVNDGSSDSSPKIIDRFAQQDTRVVVCHLAKNQGMSFALNTGISMAKGDWIVRMDSDDIAYPERFERQLAYLKEHPNVDVLGTGIDRFFDDPNKAKAEFFQADLIRAGKPPVAHPTVFIRPSVIERFGGYDARSAPAEDVELWYRWCSQRVRFDNVPEVLLKYRVHGQNMSIQRQQEQLRKALQINLRALFRYRFKFSFEGYRYILEQILYLIFLSLGLNRIIKRSRKS